MAVQVTEGPPKNKNSGQVRVSVRDLWKVFGPDESSDSPEKLAGLSKAEVQANYDAVLALQNVSFDVHDGETFVVMGLSGSGKSTLVRCLNRLIEPTSGSVFIDEEDVLDYTESALTDFRRTKTSMVFQQFGLLPHRTVLENAAWGLEIRDVPLVEREERAKEILELVGLGGWEGYRPSMLSGGMQQRVGLARAVASDPEILLMDEPFSALDPLIRRDMQNELVRLQDQMRKTTIFITHDLAEAVKLGTRIAIMRDGAIIQTGTPEEIVGNPVDDYVADFTRDVRPATVLTVGYLMDPKEDSAASLPPSRPEVEVNSEQTVDEVLAEKWSTPGQLPVTNETGEVVGVIDRDTLLQVAFSQTDLEVKRPGSPSSTATQPVISKLTEDKPTHRQLMDEIATRFSRLGTRIVLGLSILALVAITMFVSVAWTIDVGFPSDLGPGISENVNDSIKWTTRTGAPVFNLIADVTLQFLLLLERLLLWLPWATVIAAISLVAWITVGWRLALFSVVSLFVIGNIGLWDSCMETVALIIVAVVFSIAIAIPIGILAARSKIVDSILRPILDGMQTMPAFVYLVPGIMLFGIGNVPAIFATVIYAVPPAIRLTSLGIRQVTPEVLEAAESFGTTRRQLLLKVQIPMAIPTIMAGINQTIMMALAMVVIASLVGAGGLGEDVLRALSRFKPGEALLGGLAIVVLAIIVDRITQAWARDRQNALRVDTK